MAEERESLEAWLEFYRETLPLKVAGLSAEQLCEPSVPPSSLTLIGVVRHLSEVERYWFSNVVAGSTQEPSYGTAEDPDADFNGYSNAAEQADLDAYQVELAAAREHAAAVSSLDNPVAGKRHGQELNLRWIYTHMIEEYARHLGHMDLLRECVDGTTGY